MNIHELTEAQVEKLAAKLPLPTFKDEQEEIFIATQFVESRKKSVACFLLGKMDLPLKREWNRYKKEWQESTRFRQWCSMHGAKFDGHRGKYLAFLP